jgi:hypothetical protein
MENTLLNFEKFVHESPTAGEFWVVQDFTNLYFNKIPKKYYNDLKYYTKVKVDDGEFLDLVSYKYYKTTKRWDVIAFINNIHSHIVLPKDNNTILTKADSMFARWEVLHGGSKPKWFKAMKLKYFENLCFAENETHRYVKVIRAEYLGDFLYDLEIIYKDYQDKTDSFSDTLIV